MNSKKFSLVTIAIALVAMLAGCSSSNQGAYSDKGLPWYDQPNTGTRLAPTQAQKDQVTKDVMKQGNGTIRKPGQSGFIGFGQIK